jgi:cellulose synthase/poly-beta-1,6-N-acetylglucosamine synthase-like glycosyltransferase
MNQSANRVPRQGAMRAAAPDPRAMARELGLSFHADGLSAAPEVDAPIAMAAGIAPLAPSCAPLRFAIAPTALSADLLRRSGVANRPDIALMPEAAFRAILRRDGAASLSDHAGWALERRFPGQSARGGLSRMQTALLCALALAVPLGLWLQPTLLAVAMAGLATPLFYALVWLRFGASFEMMAPDAGAAVPGARTDLPVYTVLVPLHREPETWPQLLAALTSLDYPVDRLDIKIIIEADDSVMRDVLAAHPLPSHVDVIVAPPGAPRTKPRALNIGLVEARGEFLTIYDAEDRPEPDQLRRAVEQFRRLPERVACLQARLVIDNVDDGWLTRLFALEYAGLFDIVNAGLLRARLPVLLGGTSNHFRTSALRRVGGWDAWNVTEDADLSFRLVRQGYRMADLRSATFEEAPPSLPVWFRQRVRWMKGFMQTTVTHTRDPRWMGAPGARLESLTLLILCAGTVVSALAYPFFWWSILRHAFGEPLSSASIASALWAGVWGGLFVSGLVAMIMPPLIGARRRGLGDIAWWSLLMPLYAVLISAATWVAIVEYWLAPSRWNKTPHGLARTSRLRPGRP